MTTHYLRPMRNATKLKLVLSRYDCLFSINDAGIFRITMFDKADNSEFLLEGESYTEVLRKAYSRMLKQKPKE